MSLDLTGLIGQSALLSALPPQVISQLAQQAQTRVLRVRENLFDPDNRSPHMWLLGAGRVRYTVITQAGEFFVCLARPGDLMGIEAFWSDSPRTRAVAVDTCSVISLPLELIREQVYSVPAFSFEIATYCFTMHRNLLSRLEDIMLYSVQQRLLRFLLRLGEVYGSNSANGGLLIDVGLSHHDLAASIGTSRETATTVLNGLKQDGHLDIGRKTITLIDLNRLRLLADLPQATAHESH